MSDLRRKTSRRQSIANIRNGTMPPITKRSVIASMILEYESEDGSTFFHLPDHTPYARLASGEVFSLARRSEGFLAHLEDVYGLNPNDPITKHVYETIRTMAMRNGLKVELRRFAKFDNKTRQLYVSQYNGSMWRLDGDTVETMANGSDSCYFADDDGGVGLESPAEIGENGVLFETLTNLSFATETASKMTAEVQQRILITWLFALAFPDLQPTKPILIVEGVPGSGKTASLQLIQLTLFGSKKPLILRRNQEDEFGVMLLRSPLALIDNLDSFIDWVPDAVCAYATSGQWVKRKLYTDDAETIVKPQAFIAVASKNPASFRRNDTAERSLVIRLARRSGFTQQGKLEASILALRPKLLGEYLFYLNRIVEVIRSGILDEAHDERLRMADFAAFLRAVAVVFEWSSEEVDAVIDAIEAESSALIDENDPLVELLDAWLNYRTRAGSQPNVNRVVLLTALFSELKALAGVGATFYENPKVLKEKLKSPHLARRFVIESHVDPNYANKITYTIRRLGQPKLEVLAGGKYEPSAADPIDDEAFIASAANLPKAAGDSEDEE